MSQERPYPTTKEEAIQYVWQTLRFELALLSGDREVAYAVAREFNLTAEDILNYAVRAARQGPRPKGATHG